MFSKTIFLLVSCISLATSQLIVDTVAPIELKTSSFVAPEKAYKLPVDETTESWEDNVDTTESITTESLQEVSVPTGTPDSQSEVAPEAQNFIPLAPFFSDLAGAFGSHQLLAKRSVAENVENQNETEVATVEADTTLTELTPSSNITLEEAHELPKNDSNKDLEETDEGWNLATTTSEPTTSANQVKPIFIAPFFSDLAGAFGSHQLLAKRSVPADELQLNEADNSLTVDNNQTTAETSNSSQLKTSSTEKTTLEGVYELVQDDEPENEKENFKTSEASVQPTEDLTTSLPSSISTSSTPKAKPIFVAPFFSDLAGVFGSHQLLAKRSVPEGEEKLSEAGSSSSVDYKTTPEIENSPKLEASTTGKQTLEELYGLTKNFAEILNEPLDGISREIQETECRNVHPERCQYLATQGFCTVPYAEIMRLVMKHCAKTCQFC